MKEKVFTQIDSMKEQMCSLSDLIFDNPEIGMSEHFAVGKITEVLKKHGFSVELGIAGMPTAFRAVYENGAGGPSIGMLCEYDALRGLGHGCAHHIQSPVVLGAAIALKDCLEKNIPYKLVIYGTPDEEGVGEGGKVIMSEAGCFRDIDVALIMHGGAFTQADRHSLARYECDVEFLGKSAHAATHPWLGRSALDAALLAFTAVEYMREHVADDTRMHHTIADTGGKPANVVADYAKATFELRSRSNGRLATIVEWFHDILKGAAMMTETTYRIDKVRRYHAKFAVDILHELFFANARLVGAKRISEPRQRTGSTDFGHVMQIVPGIGFRIAFVESGASHSQEWLDAGKSDDAHEAIISASKILAGIAIDLIASPENVARMKNEYKTALAESNAS